MLLKVLYKTIRGICSGDGHKDEVVISIWEFAAVVVVAGAILYWLMCGSNILDSDPF